MHVCVCVAVAVCGPCCDPISILVQVTGLQWGCRTGHVVCVCWGAQGGDRPVAPT